MKRVLVAVKRVVDYNARIRVKADKARLTLKLPYAHALHC